jgi:hypothetical protein
MTTTEKTYITAYRNVIRAVSDARAYVTPALHAQIDTLEATMSTDQIERLRDIARNF